MLSVAFSEFFRGILNTSIFVCVFYSLFISYLGLKKRFKTWTHEIDNIFVGGASNTSLVITEGGAYTVPNISLSHFSFFFLNNREFMFNETVQRLYCRLWRNIPWLYRTDIAEDDDIPGNVRLHPGESVEFIIPPHYTHRIQLGSSLNRAKCASEERKHTSLYHCGVWNVSDVRHQDTFTIWTKKKKDQDRLQTSFWCFAKCVSTAMWSKKK